MVTETRQVDPKMDLLKCFRNDSKIIVYFNTHSGTAVAVVESIRPNYIVFIRVCDRWSNKDSAYKFEHLTARTHVVYVISADGVWLKSLPS